MDFRILRHIEAIERSGSLSKAAERLGISQPALSKSISRLEAQLKVQLVNRSSQGSALTALGKLMATRAATILDETRQLYRDAALAAGGESGLIRIGVSTLLRGRFTQALVETLVSNHPGLKVQVVVGTQVNLVQLLEARELDVVACTLAPEMLAPHLDCVVLGPDTLAAFAHPDHPLAALPNPTLDDLAAYRTVAWMHLDAERLFGRGAPVPETIGFYATNDYDTLMWMALSGRAPILCSAAFVAAHPDGARLKRLDIAFDGGFSYGAVTARATALLPIMRKVIRYIAEALPLSTPTAH